MLKKEKVVLRVFLLAMVITMLTACSSNDETDNLSTVLGVDLSDGTISQSTDSHGGFHGDGITFIKMTFADNKASLLAQEIEKATMWNKLPLTDNLSTAVYGKESETESHRGLVIDDEGNRLIPKVNNGYYFFYDRSSESKDPKDPKDSKDPKDPKDDTDLFNRYSYNFTIALYDTDTQTLYYYELDT